MKPDLYKLPPAWQWRDLGEVATLINGRAYKDDELLESGPVPVLRVGNFFSNRNWYYSDLQLPEDKYCNKGDLLYAWSASFGPKIWDGEKAIFHYHIWKIVTSPLLDKKYLYYLLASESASIKSAGNGIAMMHATKGGMEKRKIPLPPLVEQQKIAAILDAADSLRQKDQQLVERYTALSQSLFLEMFGDPVTNPMGWSKESLGNILSITSSKRIFEDEYVDSGIPFYRTREIVELSKGEKLTLELFISEERYSEIKSKFDIPKIGDILISAVGTIGVMWVVNTDDPFYFKDGNLIWMKASTIKNVNPVYLKMTLDHLLGYEKFRLAEGGAYNALTIAKLKDFGVLLAPIEIQNQFAERIQLIEAQKQQAQRGLEKSEALFNSLLQRAFTGELTAKMAA